MGYIKDKLNEILEWLNTNYDQDSENYSIFHGPKPEVVKYEEHIALSFWACGVIVCVNSILYFLEEDDGNWFIPDSNESGGIPPCFCVGWAESFAEAVLRIKKYTEENGTPVYFSGTDTICYYTL